MNDATDLLNEIAKLMELQGENPFKVRAFRHAAEVLAECPDWRVLAKNNSLSDLKGVGKGIAQVLLEYWKDGKSQVRDSLSQALPAGLIDLVQVPGLGPKKAKVLIEELGIRSVGELEYACRENRLLQLKGFGEKVQQKILEGALFYQSHQGFLRLSDALPLAEALLVKLRCALPGYQISETGALRRFSEILPVLEFLVEVSSNEGKVSEICQKVVSEFLAGKQDQISVRFYFSPLNQFGYELARTTATEAHWKALGSPKTQNTETEESFYHSLSLSVPPSETRETGDEVALVRSGELQKILPWEGIKGIFHNHTNASDGSATVEEMVLAARQAGYEYIGISDHSQSAVYARGLLPDTLKEQQKEIRRVQNKYPDIRIFWGIESDILADGSLDYDSEVLKCFDFVIASVHSRFGMDRKAMTDRILKAVQNPHTRFLGHMTGRLLLGRKAYDLDVEAVLSEAAKNQVAVELNANPHRLDIDWRYGSLMRKFHTLTSVNPDAHSVEGIKDTWYGIAMARKALLPLSLVVNARSVKEVEKWLSRS